MTKYDGVKIAKGTTGFLLKDYTTGGMIFRVYGPGKSFTDYTLAHSDLQVKIVDDDAVFIDLGKGKGKILDHNPSVWD